MQETGDNTHEPESGAKPVLSRRTTGRRIADIDALTEEERERLERRNKAPERLQEIARVVQKLIDEKEKNGGTLRGTGARKAAALKLGVSISTIDNYMERYKADPRIESLIDLKRGRTPGGTFTEKQKAILALYFINSQKQVIGSNGETSIVPGLEDVRYMQEVLAEHAPDPPHSNDAVRRFLRLLRKDRALVAELARRGERFIEAKVLPARRNDPERANDRWQIDGRPLPIYISHDGVVCTVTLLLIIDDLSQYPLRARLIPRKLRDEKGIPKRSDFTAADVGVLIASAIYHSGICPATLYNDHGSQLIAIEEFLNDLSDENQAVIRMSKSIPRRPRGRGKIENMLKIFDELLKDVKGNVVGRERDFEATREAKSLPDLLSLADLQKKCDEYIEILRNKPRREGEKKTRRDLWSDPLGVRKAPPVRRLMYIVPERRSRDTAIDYWHFQFDTQEYEPRLRSEEDLYRWMVAAARKESVPLRAAKFDSGWECDICLDRDDAHWCEGVLKTERYLTKEEYAPMLGRVLARAKREHADLLNALQLAVKEIGLDKTYKHDVTKKPVVVDPLLPKRGTAQDSTSAAPPDAAPNIEDTSATSSENGPASKGEQPKTTSSVSVRTAPPRKGAEPVGRKFDWSKVPKAQDTWNRIAGEEKQEEDGVMSVLHREAFVMSSLMPARVRRLNRAVKDCELLFVLAPSGAGKDRFFDWWWQEGCARTDIVQGHLLNPNEVVMVSLTPPPSGSVPPTCVAFSKIWYGLQELDRALAAKQRARPTGKTRSWYTEQQSLSLVYDNVLPLADELNPQAFVLLNGEYLDKRAMQYLLELRSPLQRGRPQIARRALIICESVDPAHAENSKFAKMASEIKELRAAWPKRLEIGLMEAPEFQEVLLMLVQSNLKAVLSDDINADEVVQEAAEWTQAEWRLIVSQLVPLIDEELGPRKGEETRLLTKNVWERVRRRWAKRQW